MRITELELREAEAPIASLISKSEKAQQNLATGTWQHAMLRDNLKALRIASSLMRRKSDSVSLPRVDLQEAMSAIASMISKVEKTQAGFVLGTSQHTLQRNRLNALRVAEALVNAELLSSVIFAVAVPTSPRKSPLANAGTGAFNSTTTCTPLPCNTPILHGHGDLRPEPRVL